MITFPVCSCSVLLVLVELCRAVLCWAIIEMCGTFRIHLPASDRVHYLGGKLNLQKCKLTKTKYIWSEIGNLMFANL